MVSAKPMSAKNPKNVYHIGGLQVEFPYQPYGSQFAFMGRVISTLNRAQREGHCHALLESPTGTGKSLSLLCSSLAWQQNYKSNKHHTNLSHLKPAPEATTDPLVYGGGFVPDEVSPTSENMELPETEANKMQKKKAAPTIYYASRTHSQISQVIRELRKTSYRVPMAVLASRKHYCTNKHILAKDNIDEECKLLLKDQAIGCPEFKNAHKVKSHPSLQRGGCHEVHDIEDLVKVGQAVKGCSYYAARSMSDDAQLVFCPYSYIINPVIRGAMDVDIKGAIVILDEAHNIEDITRDAGSVDIEEDVLDKLQMELQQLCPFNALIYQPLYEMVLGLTSWIERRKNKLEKRDFQHYVSCWTGSNALTELQEANISLQCFPILLECATKAIKVASDLESDLPRLSGMSVITLEGLFSSLAYFFSRNGSHMLDYQLALQRSVKKEAGRSLGTWTHTLSLWCLNPAVVFSDIANLSLSVILTSGTLSPMNSFSSELGVQFESSLEAPHVINVDSQVWPAIICTGPGNYPLNASYKTADGYAFQDAVGRSLEEIFKTVPGGCLVFFPSYKLMEKLCNRWSETGQWSRLNAEKSLFVEPRGGSQDDFELALKGYYDSIHLHTTATLGRKRRVKNGGFSHLHAVNSPKNSKKGGAALLGVCRGKVSEGIDFSDDNARVVIIVGIPFPNINDIQVALKKKYNDTYKSSKNLLSGNEWYCHQAFRALNQAAGRCIRHRLDYGAVILLDERFQDERNRAFISKWLRKTLRIYDNFDLSLKGLKSFFENAKEQFGTNVTQNLSLNQECDEAKDHNMGFIRKKNKKLLKSDNGGERTIEMIKDESQPSEQKNSDAYNCKDCFDPKDCKQSVSCFTGVLSAAVIHEEVSLVKETPCMDGSIIPACPGYGCKDEHSSSTLIEASSELNDQSILPISSSIGSKASSTAQCLISVTPEKNVTANSCHTVEIESSLNRSVNSHTQKRRKSMDIPFISLIEEKNYTTPCASIPSRHNVSLVNVSELTNRNESDFQKKVKSNSLQSQTRNLTCSLSLADPLMEKMLQIFCSLCRSPLGRPENNLYITCSLTLSSKVHLRSLLKQRLKGYNDDDLRSVPVIITCISYVDQRICNRVNGSVPEQGIWCPEDGCVFRSMFCPFCSKPNNLLGVQIMATDASNNHLLDKMLFYFDFLEVKNLEESRSEASKKADLLPNRGSGVDEIAILNSFDKFEESRVLKTGKSKRLPR
ncbi:Fanconi anemia group J protein homolog isoform X1 [Neltuma alba]|uniref:Fanconi anemia group J protein homolog isoform X1 n=2 Tax=Neltuma alba TaxID=207710 RepID=UPI0010A44432|nr:Fanconi anemia group J protein homolog isoform X1 [Prosopis alba]XP_028765238.1 Fanconi anemia group J protein homolog isoform X1 [Prosopis alba]